MNDSVSWVYLKRFSGTKLATAGRFYVGNKFCCYSLEDPIRNLGERGEGKIFGETAIPEGEYDLLYTYSAKFKRKMLLINDVPFFTGIRIHGGNKTIDTKGCPLCGDVLTSTFSEILPGTSTPAITRLESWIVPEILAGKKFKIKVLNEFI